MFSGLIFNAIHLRSSNKVTNANNGNIDVLKDMLDIRDASKHCHVLLDIDQV